MQDSIKGFLRLIHCLDKNDEVLRRYCLSRNTLSLLQSRGNGSLKCWATFKKADRYQRQRRNLQDLPGDGDSGLLARPAIFHHQRQRRARDQTTKMCRIIDHATAQVPDEEIDNDHRQHAGAKSALESFRQLMTKLDPKNKENADQSKERARRSRRRNVVSLEKKTTETAQLACLDQRLSDNWRPLQPLR